MSRLRFHNLGLCVAQSTHLKFLLPSCRSSGQGKTCCARRTSTTFTSVSLLQHTVKQLASSETLTTRPLTKPGRGRSGNCTDKLFEWLGSTVLGALGACKSSFSVIHQGCSNSLEVLEQY